MATDMPTNTPTNVDRREDPRLAELREKLGSLSTADRVSKIDFDSNWLRAFEMSAVVDFCHAASGLAIVGDADKHFAFTAINACLTSLSRDLKYLSALDALRRELTTPEPRGRRGDHPRLRAEEPRPSRPSRKRPARRTNGASASAEA